MTARRRNRRLNAAARITGALRQSIKGLRDAPRMGRPVKQSTGLEIRQMVFPPYIVRYLVTTEAVMILRVWHGKERQPE